jgi:hypothetical protein
MTLEPAQIAALAIRIVIARYCDVHIELESNANRRERAADHVGDELLIAVRGELEGSAKSATLVKDLGRVPRHLQDAATKVENLIAGYTLSGVSAEVQGRIGAAVQLLKVFAAGVCSGVDGPGAIPAPAHSWRFLDIAGLIEEQARTLYTRAKALPFGFPAIEYQTVVIGDDKQTLFPFRIRGQADISIEPRCVTITIKDGELYALDLCQVAYALYHELICHAFQAIGGGSARENSPESCPWTEGWMDTMAFDLALQWVEAGGDPHPWLPLVGRDAIDAMQAMHGPRYDDSTHVTGSKLGPRIAGPRRAARRTMDNLKKAFVAYLAVDLREAHGKVEEFSLILNAHSEGTPEVLRHICKHLVRALDSPERIGQNANPVAFECSNFRVHRKLDKLETELMHIAIGL